MVKLQLEKYREDFSENEEYLKLVDISTSRKLELFNDCNLLTYHQLRKRINKSGLKFEVHHRIPRYRMKGAEKSLLNCGENLLLLTVEEHLMAHYYLVQFEVSNWKYSASMAFIQLTSLKQQDISLLNEDRVKLLVKEVAVQRFNYFGSEANREVSRKAGVKSGKKRKERMKNDPEFAEYIMSKLHSKETREKRIESRLESVQFEPYWDRPGSKKKAHSPSSWEYSQLVFIGCKLGVSYKKLAKFANIDFKVISNVVRIMQRDIDSFQEFEDWKFYSHFLERFPDYPKYDEKELKLYCSLPWRDDSDSWVHIDEILLRFPPEIRGILTVSDLTGYTNINSRAPILSWLQSKEICGIVNIEDWVCYEFWKDYRNKFTKHSLWRGGCVICNTPCSRSQNTHLHG